MKNTEQTILPEINSIVKRIVEFLAPEKVILFGSYAYGNITPDSDLDLLEIMETDLPAAVKNPLEIQRSLRRVDPFIHEVLQKGEILYERGDCSQGVSKRRLEQSMVNQKRK